MFNLFKKNNKEDDIEEIKKFLTMHLSQLIKAKDKIPEDVFDVTKFFIEENLDIYESMNILMSKNHFRGCIPLSRSILENSINLQYIYKEDTEQRAKNFKLASMDSFLKRYNDFEDNSPQYKEMKNVFENQLKYYVKDRKNIKEKFEEVNSHLFYKEAYKRLSGYVHSEYKINRDFTENRPYNNYLKRLVFTDTLLVTLEALKVVCEKFDLDGNFMVIDDLDYNRTIFFSTNPKKMEEINNLK